MFLPSKSWIKSFTQNLPFGCGVQLSLVITQSKQVSFNSNTLIIVFAYTSYPAVKSISSKFFLSAESISNKQGLNERYISLDCCPGSSKSIRHFTSYSPPGNLLGSFTAFMSVSSRSKTIVCFSIFNINYCSGLFSCTNLNYSELLTLR